MYTIYVILAALIVALIGLTFLVVKQKKALTSMIEDLRADLEHFKKEVPSRRIIPK